MYQPEKLKSRRKALGLKQLDVAEKLGITYQAVSAWERGVKEPPKEKIPQLERILDVPEGYFTEMDIVRYYNTLSPKNKDKATNYVKSLVDSEQKKVIPISEKRFAYRVYERMSAGIGASVYDDKDYDTVYFDEELPHDFASWIDGDSMEPTYHNQDVALIRETGFDYDGAVYAVVWNDQTYIKKVYCEKDGLRLVSINKDYKDKFASYDDNPRIVGKIVGSFTPLEV